MASVQDALTELSYSERNLTEAYGRAAFLWTNGILTAEQHAAYHTLRDSIFATSQSLYGTLTTLLTPFGVADQVPAPTRYPDLPAFGSMPQPLGLPVRTEGLGLAPVVWAILILSLLARLVLAGIIAWAIVRAWQIGVDTARAIQTERENTSRYETQVKVTQERFIACLRRTGDAAACAGAFPVPEPRYTEPPAPLEDPGMRAVTILSVIGGLGAVGWLFWVSRGLGGKRESA